MAESKRTIHLVSLGCPKNRVDSEVMLGVAMGRGYHHVDDPEEADVIVVNTCGFIDPAKKESVDTILEMADFRSEGRCDKLVVAGCLSQRHPEEMARELPEVDHFLGSSDMLKLGDVLAGQADRVLVGQPADWVIAAENPRTLSSRPGSAYLKIAEGCNRQCAFCVIPSLRGKQRSRSIDDVVREAERLVSSGVKELNLISQDTVSYGRDTKNGGLAKLVERVAEVTGVHWVRLFYLYPEKLDDSLVDLLADHPRVLPYVDMPLQHAADGMLRRMRRGHGGQRLYDLVERLRGRVKDLTFRTAFIVGHPGETDQEFEELLEFVNWARFDRVGVFRYSDEEGSHAALLDDKVDEKIAEVRYHQLMEMAREIAAENNAALVDRELEVLVEGRSDEHDLVLMGRHQGQAPSIDGQVYLTGTEYLERQPAPGEIVKVRVTQSSDYDLAGEVTGWVDEAPTTRPMTSVRLRVLPSDHRDVT